MSEVRPWYACTGDPCICPQSRAQTYDRDTLIVALDRLHMEACVNDHPAAYAAAQRVSAALGWSDPDEWPDGQWVRAALREVLR